MRLARPVYEILPFAYVAIGCVAILVSYFDGAGARAAFAFALGLAAQIAGLTLWLRRQDYRELRRRYSGEAIDRPH
jgi:hypothetical protein